MQPRFVSLADVERFAEETLPPMVRDYWQGGAMDETTLRANRDAFGRIALRPRVLADVSQRDLSTTVLGRNLAMPVLLAPTAFHRLAHPDGELATARAARVAGVVQILSTLSTTPVEDVCRANPGGTWFQLYVYRDREATRALVRRAEDAGCAALVVTVDAPVLGRRERDIRGGFHLPAGIVPVNVVGAPRDMPRVEGQSALATWFEDQIDPSLSWRDLDGLRSMTRLPLVLKGVLRGDDAARAVECGVDGIVVSNHGGRQLDGAVASIDALPEVAAAARDVPVLVDGGVRRGTDVVRALALGAKAVLLGRPQLHGLAAGGEWGVSRVLSILSEETDHAMALCGCRDVASITRDLVR